MCGLKSHTVESEVASGSSPPELISRADRQIEDFFLSQTKTYSAKSCNSSTTNPRTSSSCQIKHLLLVT